jgi:hypothetical protein
MLFILVKKNTADTDLKKSRAIGRLGKLLTLGVGANLSRRLAGL